MMFLPPFSLPKTEFVFDKSITATVWSSSIPAHAAFFPEGEMLKQSTPFVTAFFHEHLNY